MNRLLCVFAAIFLCVHSPAFAVATVSSSGTTYKTTEPTNVNVQHWTSGWGNTLGLTGWDYVGYTNYGGSDQASAVYLGDGWVLTAGHANLSSFTLAGVTYSVSNVTYIANADLKLFKIPVTLSLPSLAITGTTSLLSAGSTVVMIGNGGGSESWSTNKVDAVDYEAVSGSYTTDTFYSYVDTRNNSGRQGQVVPGDSGGADFYYNSATGEWVLVGINCYAGTGIVSGSSTTVSFMADLSDYADEIQAIMLEEVPEPSTWVLLALGSLACARHARRKQR